MVEGASGVGAGSLSITGTIDTKDIERGFARIKVGLNDVENKSNSFNSDLIRMNLSASRLGSRLAILAGTASLFLTNLAKGAPAVAPAMAKIGVQFERFQRTLGRALQPQFEAFSGAFQRFVDFADAHPDVLSGFVLSAAAIGGIRALGALLGISVSPTVLGALALLWGASFGLSKLAESGAEKLNEVLGLQAGGTTAGGFADALGQYLKSILTGEPTNVETREFLESGPSIQEIIDAGYDPTPGGTISASQEENRRFFLLNWWDAVFG
jgi:hypothetical protein